MKLVILLAASTSPIGAIAEDVYRWKDKDGKVHFGDRNTAPPDSRKVEIRAAAGLGQAAAKDHPAKAAPAPAYADDMTRCAAYARAMVGSAKAEWLANADKIKSTCPGTGFECTTFNGQPEKNKCEPFPFDGKGTFFKDVKRGFPVTPRP